jgi:ATPase subunit of ABC transporter with duplicated ATPase domains
VETLQSYEGTLVFVSHDRWFVGQLATRIVEVRADGIRDYQGSYDEYLAQCGDDHLDADRVVLAAKAAKGGRAGKTDKASKAGRARPERSEGTGTPPVVSIKELAARREAITGRIEQAEARLAEIDTVLSDVTQYQASRAAEFRELGRERAALTGSMERLMAEWESVEREADPSLRSG